MPNLHRQSFETGSGALRGQSMSKGDANKGWNLWRRIIVDHLAAVSAVAVLIVLQVTMVILLARQLGSIIDVGLLADRAAFGQVFLLLVVLWLGSDAVLFGRQLLTGRLAEIVVHNLRGRVVRHISRATTESLAATHSGDYVSRLGVDTEAIRVMVAREMPGLVQGMLGFVAALVVMLVVSWQVTLLTIALVPVMMFVSSFFGGRMGGSLKAWQSAMAAVNVLAQDTVLGIVVAKTYALHDYLGKQMSSLSKRAANNAVALAFTKGQLNAAMTVLSVMPFLVLFGVGGYEVIRGRLSLGQLLMLLNLLNNLTWPLQGMAQNMASMQAAIQAAERIFAVLALPVEPVQQGACPPLNRNAEYAVEYDRVSFAYPGKDATLCELNLKVRTGETLALIGASGSGKSTLLSLMLRFRQPSSGELLFFGCPYHDLTPACIREHIAYVAQEDFFLPVSVAENIGFGRLSATPHEVSDSARRVGADEFIGELTDGYSSLLSERGGNFSGGQRQRISLARAVLRAAPLLALDEATSALDMESERAIFDELLAMDGTKIIVTHRLHLLEKVDRIVVLANGSIVEEGTHAVLVARGSHYANFVRHGEFERHHDAAGV